MPYPHCPHTSPGLPAKPPLPLHPGDRSPELLPWPAEVAVAIRGRAEWKGLGPFQLDSSGSSSEGRKQNFSQPYLHFPSLSAAVLSGRGVAACWSQGLLDGDRCLGRSPWLWVVVMAGLSVAHWLLNVQQVCSLTQPQSPISLTLARWSCLNQPSSTRTPQSCFANFRLAVIFDHLKELWVSQLWWQLYLNTSAVFSESIPTVFIPQLEGSIAWKQHIERFPIYSKSTGRPYCLN